MKKFLFITHETPQSKRSELRQSLYNIHKKALVNQTYSNWTSLVFGERESKEGQFIYKYLSDADKETKMLELKNIFESLEMKEFLNQFDYIIKLDDDDIISNCLLQDLSNMEFDCCYDKYHTFYEISSGQITQQQRPWIASTCVHKRAHAMANYSGEGASMVGNLLYSIHSASWHKYYEGKITIIRDKKCPVYLRVLSPTSITALQGTEGDHISAEMKYSNYLNGFGAWHPAQVIGFNTNLEELSIVWLSFARVRQKPLNLILAKRSIISRIITKLKILFRAN